MGAYIGFFNQAVSGAGGSTLLVDWTHQPYGRGYNPKPIAEDSTIVTVQIATKLITPFEPLSFAEDVYANIAWNAAAHGDLEAEVDAWPGVGFSLIATHVIVKVGWVLSSASPNRNNPLMSFNATIGRGTRPGGDGPLVRTRRVGPLAPAAVSGVVTIPAFARSLSVVTRSSPPAFSVRVRQLSNGVVVQVDDIIGPAFGARALVHRSADSFTIENIGLGAGDFYVPFHLAFM